MAEEQQGPVLSIEKIYLKDASVEVPNAPQVFLENVQPQIDVQMGTQAQQIADGLFETTLSITVTAKAGDRTLFLCEAAQAAIFQIRGFGDEEMQAILGIGCPTTVFPYARETIASLVQRAGFPPINLAPVSFEALYMQQMQQMQQQNGGGPQIQIAS
jgi:preprotein translocase subunit SecB